MPMYDFINYDRLSEFTNKLPKECRPPNSRLEEVQSTLLNSWKPSTRRCAAVKWKRFSLWYQQRHLSPEVSGIPLILEYLLSWKGSGLSISSLWVHLGAINAFHLPGENSSFFTYPTTVKFLKGMIRTFLKVLKPMSSWDLSLVLPALMNPPFKPMAFWSSYTYQ